MNKLLTIIRTQWVTTTTSTTSNTHTTYCDQKIQHLLVPDQIGRGLCYVWLFILSFIFFCFHLMSVLSLKYICKLNPSNNHKIKLKCVSILSNPYLLYNLVFIRQLSLICLSCISHEPMSLYTTWMCHQIFLVFQDPAWKTLTKPHLHLLWIQYHDNQS